MPRPPGRAPDPSPSQGGTGITKRVPKPLGTAVLNPFLLADRAADFVYGCYWGVFGLGLTRPDDPNPFRPQPDAPGELDFTFPAPGASVPLAKVKEVTAAMGCTLNDVAVATLGLAFGCYFRAEGLAASRFRLMAPVNTRGAATLKGEEEFGNKFVFAVINTPVATADPLEARRACSRPQAPLLDTPRR